MDPSLDIRTKTGGAYIPPAKLRLMQQQIEDKNSEQYQRLSWETLKKSINGLINKVNVGNIAVIVKELFEINLIRGRGMLVRSLIKAQVSSPTFTHVYAALIAVCNTKFPKIGELLLKRLIIQFRRFFQRNDKQNCINTTRFIAHLVNQQIAHEVIALEILILLLENATNDSVEVAIAFLKECGAKLDEVSRKGATAIFERLRNILHDGELNKRVQYMIEVMFAVRKDKFKDHPAVLPELDLIEESDQFTHLMTLEDTDLDSEDRLNVFQFDEKFQENEQKYETIKKDILDADSDDDDGDDSGSGSGSDDDDEDGDDEDQDGKAPKLSGDAQTIIDKTETDLITLRKTIYLTIQSSLDFEECAHKLLKLEVQPAQYPELCNMIVDCCAQQRTYIKFFGLLAQRFCQLNQEYVEPFKDIFKKCYDTIHRFETCKLRNVAKLFAHLLHTDAIPWTVLEHIKLNEYDTTSSSRVFIKILFQQLAESLGLVKLNGRIKDATLQEAFEGLFPRDNPQNTRFAINFFTSIGLGGLTDDLREHLKTAPVAKQPTALELLTSSMTATAGSGGDSNKVKKEDEDSSEDDSSSSSDDSSSSSSDSSDDSSEDDSSSSSSGDDSSADDHRGKRKHSSKSKRSSSSKHHKPSSSTSASASRHGRHRHDRESSPPTPSSDRRKKSSPSSAKHSKKHRKSNENDGDIERLLRKHRDVGVEESSKNRSRRGGHQDHDDGGEPSRHRDHSESRRLKERNHRHDHDHGDDDESSYRASKRASNYDIKEEIVDDDEPDDYYRRGGGRPDDHGHDESSRRSRRDDDHHSRSRRPLANEDHDSSKRRRRH